MHLTRGILLSQLYLALDASMGSIEQQKLFTALVVGAGIGGLSAAIALSRNGVDVTILESKPELNEFGASIGISPYTVKVIRAYGLGEQFKSFVTENRCVSALRNLC